MLCRGSLCGGGGCKKNGRSQRSLPWVRLKFWSVTAHRWFCGILQRDFRRIESKKPRGRMPFPKLLKPVWMTGPQMIRGGSGNFYLTLRHWVYKRCLLLYIQDQEWLWAVTLKNLSISMCLIPVITSYSIHYTKLYEIPLTKVCSFFICFFLYSFDLSMGVTTLGSALPRVFFMTWPMKKLNSLVLPSL